jgi:4-hydroxy-tetrahydrodipicolinate synthase
VGIKEASGNMVQCMELMRTKPIPFNVLSGDDNLVLAQMAIGMEGVISVAANCYTKEVTDIINLAIVGKIEKARKVLYKMLPGFDLSFHRGQSGWRKICFAPSGCMRKCIASPISTVRRETAAQIDAFLSSK